MIGEDPHAYSAITMILIVKREKPEKSQVPEQQRKNG